MVNNGEKPKAPDITRLVGLIDVLTCKKCHKSYTPDKKEISSKNPNVYYKTCYECRLKQCIYHKEYRMKSIKTYKD